MSKAPNATTTAAVVHWYASLRGLLEEMGQHCRGTPQLSGRLCMPPYVDHRLFEEVDAWLRPAILHIARRCTGADVTDKVNAGFCGAVLRLLDRFPLAPP